MAIATSSDSTAWSTPVAIATDTPFQCQRGSVRVSWATPASLDDGVILTAGQLIVLPAGISFVWRPLSNIECTVQYLEFGA